MREIAVKTFSDAFESQNNPEDFRDYMQKAFSEDQLLTELNHPDSHFYFALTENGKAGYFKLNFLDAQSDIKDPMAAELERIYVYRSYQGKNIGRWMVQRAVEIVKKFKKTYIWLGVWQENKAAIRFYEKMGFEKFGQHPYYIGKDRQMDWLMKMHIV